MRHPAEPFAVSLASIEEGRNRLRLEGTAEDLGISGDELALDGGVVLEGEFYRADRQVEIQGHVRAPAVLSCDLCLEPIHRAIEAPFRLLCEKRGDRDRRSGEQSGAEEVGLLYHDGRTLDLRDEVRQAILLEVPWHPLCRPDCRGLCPSCGSNRNEGECGCPPRTGRGPWDKLRVMVEDGGASPPVPGKKKRSEE